MILEPPRLLLGDWVGDIRGDLRGLQGDLRDLQGDLKMGNLCGAAGGVRVISYTSPLP